MNTLKRSKRAFCLSALPLAGALFSVNVFAGLPAGSECGYPEMNIRGSFNDFQTLSMECLPESSMRGSGQGPWSWRSIVQIDANDRFKFDVFGDWSENYGDNHPGNSQPDDLDLSGADIFVTQADTYRVEMGYNAHSDSFQFSMQPATYAEETCGIDGVDVWTTPRPGGSRSVGSLTCHSDGTFHGKVEVTDLHHHNVNISYGPGTIESGDPKLTLTDLDMSDLRGTFLYSYDHKERQAAVITEVPVCGDRNVEVFAWFQPAFNRNPSTLFTCVEDGVWTLDSAHVTSDGEPTGFTLVVETRDGLSNRFFRLSDDDGDNVLERADDTSNALIPVPRGGDFEITINFNEGTYEIIDRSADIKRTIVFLKKQTQSGQDLFMRGGLDWNNSGRHCDPDNGGDIWECAIPIEHNLFKTDNQRSKDTMLDWYGAQDQQGDVQGSPLVWTTNNPGNPNKVKDVGYGYTPLNRWGDHYWMLDVMMDCSKTLDGWFELKGFLTNYNVNGGWEGEMSQNGTPYASNNHFAQCGKLNVFEWGNSGAHFEDFDANTTH